MTEHIDPRYRWGNTTNEVMEMNIYMFFMNDTLAALVYPPYGEDGAFWDLEAGYAASTLADGCYAMDRETAMKWAHDFMGMQQGCEVVNIMMTSRLDVDPVTGLSIDNVQESAYFTLMDQVRKWASTEEENPFEEILKESLRLIRM